MSDTVKTKHPISAFLNAIDGIVAKIEEVMLAAGVIFMAINTIANVISRFVFNHSIIFAEELNSIFILFVTFAGIGFAARQGRHIRMSAFYDQMPDKIRKLMMTLITGITALFLLGLCYFSVVYIVNIYSQGRVMPALGVPVYAVYFWVPIGFFVTGIQYAMAMVKNITEKGIYLSTSMQEHESLEVEV